REVLEGDETNTEAMRMLGLALVTAGRPDAGARLLENALAYQPNWGLARSNYALALMRLNRFEQALDEAQMVLLDQPEDLEALRLAGHAAFALQRYDETIRHLKLFEELYPADANARLRLAAAYVKQGDAEAARITFEDMIFDDPDNIQARIELAALITDEAPEDAADNLVEALELAPDNLRAAYALARLAQTQLFWRDHDLMHTALVAGLEAELANDRPNPIPPAQLITLGLPVDLVRRAIRSTAAHIWEEARQRREELSWQGPGRAAGERLRVAYFTSNLRRHPTTDWLGSLLRAHDRERFEVTLYSAGPDDGFAGREAIVDAVEHFVDLHPSRVVEAATRIHDDRQHILVDVDMHGRGGTPRLATLRPAPVMVAGMGFPEGWGSADAIDYTLQDPIVLPRNDEHPFAERVVYLPTCYVPFKALDPAALADRDETRAACGLPEEAFVLVSTCAADVLNPETVDAWAKILEQAPQAVLWLFVDGEHRCGNLRAEFERRRVAADRILFSEPVEDAAAHIARLALADLFVDNFGCGAHVEAMDAMLAGLPVLCAPGDAVYERFSASLMTHAGTGLDALVCDDRDAFVERALALINAPGELDSLKAGVRKAVAEGPYSDPTVHARALEEALERMWQQHETSAPRGFSVGID
ncbi:MAG: tetratricopeptide repeat protein, partial [Pseudomonadota bacterium]